MSKILRKSKYMLKMLSVATIAGLSILGTNANAQSIDKQSVILKTDNESLSNNFKRIQKKMYTRYK